MKTKFLSKTELAVLYFPYIQPESAVNKLMNLIKDNDKLKNSLIQYGYKRYSKHLTCKQVSLIFEFLGEP